MLVRANIGIGLIPNPILWFGSTLEPNVSSQQLQPHTMTYTLEL